MSKSRSSKTKLNEAIIIRKVFSQHWTTTKLSSKICSIQRLFDKGCGFTEFLTKIFLSLPFEEMLKMRCVCKKWKDFIETYVWMKHKSITWLLKEFPEIQRNQKSSVSLSGTLKYLRILSIGNSIHPVAARRHTIE